jgi:hypothetical protein
MATRVFAWDANPAIDPFCSKESNARAEEDVAAGRGFFFKLSDGRRAMQLFQTKAEAEEQRCVGARNRPQWCSEINCPA